MSTDETELVLYRQLLGKLDAFGAAVAARHPQAASCPDRCHQCCLSRLTVTQVEAAAIEVLLASLPAGERAALAEQAGSAPADACPALDGCGRCSIYEVRPLVCRSHGLPIRLADRGPGEASVVTCGYTFTGFKLEQLPAGEVLDQQTLSTMLFAVDADYCRRTGLRQGLRVALLELLLQG